MSLDMYLKIIQYSLYQQFTLFETTQSNDTIGGPIVSFLGHTHEMCVRLKSKTFGDR